MPPSQLETAVTETGDYMEDDEKGGLMRQKDYKTGNALVALGAALLAALPKSTGAVTVKLGALAGVENALARLYDNASKEAWEKAGSALDIITTRFVPEIFMYSGTAADTVVEWTLTPAQQAMTAAQQANIKCPMGPWLALKAQLILDLRAITAGTFVPAAPAPAPAAAAGGDGDGDAEEGGGAEAAAAAAPQAAPRQRAAGARGAAEPRGGRGEHDNAIISLLEDGEAGGGAAHGPGRIILGTESVPLQRLLPAATAPNPWTVLAKEPDLKAAFKNLTAIQASKAFNRLPVQPEYQDPTVRRAMEAHVKILNKMLDNDLPTDVVLVYDHKWRSQLHYALSDTNGVMPDDIVLTPPAIADPMLLAAAQNEAAKDNPPASGYNIGGGNGTTGRAGSAAGPQGGGRGPAAAGRGAMSTRCLKFTTDEGCNYAKEVGGCGRDHFCATCNKTFSRTLKLPECAHRRAEAYGQKFEADWAAMEMSLRKKRPRGGTT